jgi:zinc/manganese transport system permease protein
VLARGIIFLDLAIAQTAVLGVIAAHALGWETQGWQTQLAAAAAALAGAAFLARCEARWPEIQEALIGSSFAVAASLAVLLLAGDPHGGEHLNELLAGQILWVGPSQLAQIAAVYALLLGFWRLRGERLGRMGLYLVFASLILPALAVRGRPPRAGLLVGWGLGAAAYAAGLAASALFDWPAGPAIVPALAVAALLAGRLLRLPGRDDSASILH